MALLLAAARPITAAARRSAARWTSITTTAAAAVSRPASSSAAAAAAGASPPHGSWPRPRCPATRLFPSVTTCSRIRWNHSDADGSKVDVDDRRKISGGGGKSDGGDNNDNNGTDGGPWSAFAASWNATLARRPQEVVAVFLATQSTTWLGLFTVLSASSLIFPPDLAAGWMISRVTRKFRQPLNVGMAAGAVTVLPSIALVKVSPLITGFAADAKATQNLSEARQRMARTSPLAGRAVDSLVAGAKWLEGPVDKYGLAFYGSGKITSLVTMWTAAYLIREGVDVQSVLDTWGISEGYGEAAGTIAGAATINAFLAPMHFWAVVYGVKGLEWEAKTIARQPQLVKYVDGYEEYKTKLEAEERIKRGEEEGGGERGEGKDDDDSKRGSEEKEGDETAEEFIANRAVKAMGMFLLFYSLSVSFYALRKMKETADKKGIDLSGDNNSGAKRDTRQGTAATGPGGAMIR